MGFKKLFDLELKVMKFIWGLEKKVVLGEVVEVMK